MSFSKTATIDVNALSDPSGFNLPFGVGVYEPTLMISMLFVKTIDINTLDRIRSAFVDTYFRMGHDKTHPNVLFSFQKQVKEAGHLEAYNHWILMKGDEDGFENWQAGNTVKWDDFIKWFTNNRLKIDESNRFYSGQY